jgi:hypothetical protein
VGPAGALTTRTRQVNTAAIFQFLQDARGLLGHDQGTAMSVLARASHLLGVAAAGNADLPFVHRGLARWQTIRLARYIELNLDGQILQNDLAKQG